MNKIEFLGPLNAFDIGAYNLGLGSFVSIHEGSDEEKTVVIKQTKKYILPFKNRTKLKVSNVPIMILLLITLFLLMVQI